jgi:hypothetical protein
MDKIRYCTTCKEFREQSEVYFFEKWRNFRCSICHRANLEPVAFVPINKKVNRLIKQCTKRTGENSHEILEKALKMFMVIRGYDDD